MTMPLGDATFGDRVRGYSRLRLTKPEYRDEARYHEAAHEAAIEAARLLLEAETLRELLDRYEVHSSPSALVIALSCRRCRGVITLSRGLVGGDPGRLLTLADLVAFARQQHHHCAAGAGGASHTG